MKNTEERILCDPFRENAYKIIREMVELSRGRPSPLVDEVLHSIFFLGKINTPPFSPEKIVSDADMRNELRDCYPRPFEYYSTQLPQRHPISCVLDMIVNERGQEKEDEIRESLQRLISQMQKPKSRKKYLFSSTICVSQNRQTENSVRYYGVSMSVSGNAWRIIVAASCLSTWDRYVAGAVMTYFPHNKKNPDFDGTITLPEVRCQAFRLRNEEENENKKENERDMLPCKSCSNLFGLRPSEEKEWPYGNCAEVESVSNLLKNENGVREQLQLISHTMTTAENNVTEVLNSTLKTIRDQTNGEFEWDKRFYTPQIV